MKLLYLGDIIPSPDTAEKNSGTKNGGTETGSKMMHVADTMMYQGWVWGLCDYEVANTKRCEYERELRRQNVLVLRLPTQLV